MPPSKEESQRRRREKNHQKTLQNVLNNPRTMRTKSLRRINWDGFNLENRLHLLQKGGIYPPKKDLLPLIRLLITKIGSNDGKKLQYYILLDYLLHRGLFKDYPLLDDIIELSPELKQYLTHRGSWMKRAWNIKDASPMNLSKPLCRFKGERIENVIIQSGTKGKTRIHILKIITTMAKAMNSQSPQQQYLRDMQQTVKDITSNPSSRAGHHQFIHTHNKYGTLAIAVCSFDPERRNMFIRYFVYDETCHGADISMLNILEHNARELLATSVTVLANKRTYNLFYKRGYRAGDASRPTIPLSYYTANGKLNFKNVPLNLENKYIRDFLYGTEMPMSKKLTYSSTDNDRMLAAHINKIRRVTHEESII